jgi:hypothetical protein
MNCAAGIVLIHDKPDFDFVNFLLLLWYFKWFYSKVDENGGKQSKKKHLRAKKKNEHNITSANCKLNSRANV